MADLPEPITREETYLAAAAGEGGTLPEPLTREEMYLAKAAGQTVTTPAPITRKEMYLDAIAEGGGGGGGVTVEALTVSENGTYTAPSGTAYGGVTVNVPNPSSGSITVTENGTYDVTEKASVIVNTPVPVALTQAAYDAMATYDSNTLYCIVEASS